MSGHSKWSTIKHKKGAADAARGKVFTKHAKLITLAAREGGDIEMNPKLRSAISAAKRENVPNNNIERAIKKGTGELKDGSVIEEVWYEGYGPDGIAIMVQALTDNKNRTLTNVKTAFNKNGGSLGSAGCVSYMFDRKGEIIANKDGFSFDELEMMALEAGADDIETDGEKVIFYTSPSNVFDVAKILRINGLNIEEENSTFIADTKVIIKTPEVAKKLVKILNALDDDEDTTNVYSNFEGDLEKFLE